MDFQEGTFRRESSWPSLLYSPAPNPKSEREKRTLRRPLRDLTMYPLPHAAGCGEDTVDKTAGERQAG